MNTSLKKSVLFTCLFVYYATVIQCDSVHQDCVNATTWCETFTSGNCQAKVGAEIIIPCGNLPLSPGITFTYINQSAQDVGRSSFVLARNVSDCLKLNLTVYDDRKRITCQASNTMGASYSFILIVKYPPMVIGPVPINIGKFMTIQYSLECPLVGNPLPLYFWNMFNCFSREPFINGSGITFANNNRTLTIASLTSEYRDICFICNANNSLGFGEYSFRSIPFDYCSATGHQVFIKPGQSLINARPRDNITLECIVTGVKFPPDDLEWIFNNNTYSIIGLRPIFNTTLCTLSLTLNLHAITLNNSGNYTCNYAGSITRTVFLSLNFTGDDNTPSSNRKQIVSYSVPIAVVLLLVIVLSIIVVKILLCIQHRHRKQYKRSLTLLELMQTDDVKDTNFDVFISFAEEDKEFAEFKIKKLLEQKGYKISWHHEVFIPGCSIIENMEKFIFQSRVTVVLISDNFNGSEFCSKELYIALQKEKQNAFSCIVPVLLNTSCKLPNVLKKRTYLTAGDKNFIDRLCTAIGEPIDPSP